MNYTESAAKESQIVSKNNLIRPLSPADEESMVHIIRCNLDPFEKAGSVLAASFRRLSHFYETYSQKGSVYLVAEDPTSGEPIGGVGLGPLAGLEPAEGIGEIRELVIDKSYRRQGLGLLLINEVLRQAQELNYRRLYLETTAEMEGAKRLFEKIGFKPVSQGDQGSASLPDYYVMDYPRAND